VNSTAITMQTDPLRPRHLAAGGLEKKQQDATKQDWKRKPPPLHGMVAGISKTHGVNDRPEFKNPTSNYKNPTSTHPA
jgi:hypothetical protein